MEAVAEAVMDMQAILLGNETNADKLETQSIKGTIYSLESQLIAFSHLAVPGKRAEAVTVHLTVVLCG